MVALPSNPSGQDLEDLVGAYFASRQCYVEFGIKERSPDEILELDLVWTRYDEDPPVPYPVEVKSGDWGIGDVFKFYGWTRYLGLPPGTFVHRHPCGRVTADTMAHIATRTGIRFASVENVVTLNAALAPLGLPAPRSEELAELWRFSFWAQRRLLRSLAQAVRSGQAPATTRTARQYYQLINDSVFFVPDVRDRVRHLLDAHFSHQELAATLAYEMETAMVAAGTPPNTDTFKRALFGGRVFPVQACLYLSHRARLYILKAVVDYWLARTCGMIPPTSFTVGTISIDTTHGPLTSAMQNALAELATNASFRHFPAFWQALLWSWGGFICLDRRDEEFAAMSAESGVRVEDIPVALAAFDMLFPTPGGWFRTVSNDSRQVLMLTPPVIRGIGAIRRLMEHGVENYAELPFTGAANARLAADNNSAVRILECDDTQLAAA